ncbi:MAG: aminotransferase class V-fold PLP-dependent enzyme [Longimicrobiales bacterium]|nr:aminotransferase class V-fold PLP-dependent enzyme [Longimicrobiales bacterium]
MALDRRRFLTVLGGASLAWPRAVEAMAAELTEGGAPDDEAFWRQVRSGFLIPDDRIYLNNGTLGPSPRVVVDAVTEHTRRVAATYPPGVSWDDLKASMSALVGGDPEGFVFPRNTTEAMSFVANGLEFGEGDEVVTTDHEHIGGLEPWRLVTARKGATLRVASLPVPPDDGGALEEAVWGEVTPRTRVVSVSHLTFTNGARLPVEALGRRCAEAGIVFCVDGAHPPGMLQLDVTAVGGDFYASSPHKWVLAPQGSGLLYLAEPWRRDLWPSLASGGWDDDTLGAHRFNHMGTIDESRLAGLLAASEFLLAIGMDRVEARVRYLRSRLEDGLRGMDGVHVVTPADEALKGGMVSFHVDGVESPALQRHLSRVASVRTRVIGEYDYGWMRLSTHVYNAPDEIDVVLELIDEAARTGVEG